MSDPVTGANKTRPIVAGYNTWTHQLLAGLKLDHLNVLALQLTLEPNKVATLSATIAVDDQQGDALRQALEHKHFALLEWAAEDADSAAAPSPEPPAPQVATKPKARRRKPPVAA